MSNNNRCQHCGGVVVWSARPKDAGYSAFVHLSGTVACPTADQVIVAVEVAPCPHCGELPRSWGEMDMHLRFTCPVIRAPREGVAR